VRDVAANASMTPRAKLALAFVRTKAPGVIGDLAQWTRTGGASLANVHDAEPPSPSSGERTVTVLVSQLDPDLPLPAYARPGDAGADLVARTCVTIGPGGGRALVPTGVAVAIPPGYAGFVQPRSGLALRHGVTVLNAPGLIDSGYRDELKVLLVNTDPFEPYEVRRGDRIAQLVVKAVAKAEFLPARELPLSERGLGGFGHSGR
jgi:dUTP pyrophosphatase